MSRGRGHDHGFYGRLVVGAAFFLAGVLLYHGAARLSRRPAREDWRYAPADRPASGRRKARAGAPPAPRAPEAPRKARGFSEIPPPPPPK